MAAKIRLELNHAGFQAILQSQAVMDDLVARGQRIQAAAGPEFDLHSGVRRLLGASRARVIVAANSREARELEATDKSLTSAIGAGRG